MRLIWANPMTSKEAARCHSTKGFISEELYIKAIQDHDLLKNRIAELERELSGYSSATPSYVKGLVDRMKELGKENDQLIDEVNRLKGLLQEFQTSYAVCGKSDKKEE